MRTLIWRGAVIVTLLSMYLWARGTAAGLRAEQQRDRKRVECLERIMNDLPKTLRIEHAYQTDDLLTRLEALYDK